MNSKKKNKNRQNKPPNPTPPQKKEESEPTNFPEVINTEIECVVEERVPIIVSDSVPTEVKETGETPKKPKRNRGKKKKEDDKSDKEDEFRVDESIPEAETEIQQIQDSLDVANITPTARKKKNKNKKSQDPIQVKKLEESKIEKDSQLDERSDQPPEELLMKLDEPEHEMKLAKKKNKKKKGRNDSEKSEKAEEVSCTTAFQKLLAEDVKAKIFPQPSTDNSSISEPTVKETEIEAQTNITTESKLQETVQKHDGNKNKQKNKKYKKLPTVPDVSAEQTHSLDAVVAANLNLAAKVPEIDGETIVNQILEVTRIDESIPSSSTADNQHSKQKAKIAKPVDKKKKGKAHEKGCEEKLEETVPEAQPENIERVSVTEIETSPHALSTLKALPAEDLADLVLVPITEMVPDWQEEVKIDEGNGPVIGCEDKNESTALEQPITNIEKDKNKIKSPKPERKNDISTVPFKFEEKVPETGVSSLSDQAELKPAVELHIQSEIVPDEKGQTLVDETGHIQVTHDKKDKRKKSPQPFKRNDPGNVTSTEILQEMPLVETSCNLTGQMELQLEEKHDNRTEIKPEEQEPSFKNKNEHAHVSSKDKRNSRKKSPKPPSNETAIKSNISAETVQANLSHVVETATPVTISCTEIFPMKTDELTEMNPNIDKVESSKIDEMQCSEKSHKRKKSPNPVADIKVASDLKDTKESNQNILKIEDIIIIQAEVVSDKNIEEADSILACEKVVVDDATIKMELKQSSEKSKKRKKSPKPPPRDSKKEIKDKPDTQGEIQMPVTPNIHDIKLPPEVFHVELESLKRDPMPSPSDATPDIIEYPRCSSEHLDRNNNMIIEEISHPDATLEELLVIREIPLIESSNISSLGLTTTGTKEKNLEFSSKPKEEKTDLKSKVMEVNQDMEDLRLSIERSLAELTSLEKSDTNEEKQKEEKNKQNVEITKKGDVESELVQVGKQSVINQSGNASVENKEISEQSIVELKPYQEPICPTRKDQKGKGKSKKKGKQDSVQTQSSVSTTSTEKSIQSQDSKKEEAKTSEQKSGDTQEKENKQASKTQGNKDDDLSVTANDGKNCQSEFEPIENFEDAMTSSVDDVNKTFEIIANEAKLTTTQNNPEINVIAPREDENDGRNERQNPVSPPKNLLGHPDIPVPSSRTDYKKEKNKPPTYKQAKVKIKDANQVEIETPEKSKQSKESQTESKRKHITHKRTDESICVTNKNDDYVYKYSFRKVFLQCACHICKKDLVQSRIPCSYCNLIFYCNQKHKDEDYAQHQALCFAVSTIVHLKDQKFIYADARDVTGYNYRLLRMQMIVSCEKVLKRRLAPWEQEALLYPRMCGLSSCREWRQGKLVDCEGCGQISYCSEHPDHLPKAHARWCKSYNLYRALVKHQQTQGRLEPKLPTRVVELNPLPDNINEVLASIYEEKIDMSDTEYAALTQLATAPLTALFCLQYRSSTVNGITKKPTLTVHIVGAELQFEADVLNKWEIFLLHLVPDVKELRVVLVGPDLNPSNLPLELLGKIKLCEICQRNKRRMVFGFQDKHTYHEFWASEDFTAPDLVCAFNPSIQRSSNYNGKDTWPSSINCILKLKTPFAITSYTLPELASDLLRVQECAAVGYNVLCAPKNNSFASVRPDRNFISDDEAPLLFKNDCVTVLCGV